MRVRRIARNSARKARTQTLNQMRAIIAGAPDPIRAELRHLNVYRLLERASAYRPGRRRDMSSLTKLSLVRAHSGTHRRTKRARTSSPDVSSVST